MTGARAGRDTPTVLRVSCATAEATHDLGARLGRWAGPGDVVALSGDLGAGKTCFIQGLAEGLSVSDPVTSPTFVLIAEYAGRLPLYHVDLYRTESLDEVRALGLDELIGGEWGDGVTAIEWAEKAEPLLPTGTIRVRLDGAGEAWRMVELAGLPPDWSDGRA